MVTVISPHTSTSVIHLQHVVDINPVLITVGLPPSLDGLRRYLASIEMIDVLRGTTDDKRNLNSNGHVITVTTQLVR